MIAGTLKIVLVMALVVIVPVLMVFLLVQFFRGTFWLLSNLGRGVRGTARHVWRFLRGTVLDALHLVGSLVTAAALLPLAAMNVVLLRWSGIRHFGRAIEEEFTTAFLCGYRLVIGNPARFLGLTALTDGVERRVPDLVARAPRSSRAGVRPDFPGYRVTGTLPAGGSGAELYLARPLPETLARWRSAGRAEPEEVVIKSFALRTGSTLPQIVRESRALEAAGRLDLVLEHRLDEEHFWYVMPFVPGDDMNVRIARLHARGGPDGLRIEDVPLAVSYAADLVATLQRFHAEGLWHKDIKPSNLIVCEERVHLVDLGLVTPLASALTLTTHGTEYYRDPEMVRLAMQGVKVHEVDGVKFDLYSAGAVIYSIVQDSFPAQGSLSSITKRCPEALRWIVRRAMADMKDRYASAGEMLADLRVLAAARDPFAVRPADLPSLGGRPAREPFAPLGSDDLSGGAFAGRVHARVAGGPAPAARTARCRRPGDPSTRRRAARGLVAASLWFALILGGISALVHLAFDQHALQSAGNEAVAASAVGSASATRTPAWARGLGQRLEAQLASPDPDDPAVVLLLDELSGSTGSELRSGLRLLEESEGIELLGAPWSPLQDERDILYAAGARKAVGLAQPQDPEGVESLEDYLADQTGLDAVLWLAEGPGEREVVFRVVRRRTVESRPAQKFVLPEVAAGTR